MDKIEKIDIYKTPDRLKTCLGKIQKSSLKNKDLILAYDHDNFVRGLSERRRLKILMHLRVMDGWFTKEFTTINKADMEDLILKLRTNKVTKSKKLKSNLKKTAIYSEQTKTDYLKIFKQFMRWTIRKDLYTGKENSQFLTDFNYRKDASKKKEPEILSLDQVSLLAEKASTLKYRCAIWVLFDTGARPEEFSNIRLKDVSWDSKAKKYWIEIRYNKLSSHPRKVDVPFCTEILKKYLESVRGQLQQNDPLFGLNVGKLRHVVRNHCLNLFTVKANLYTLRHSSIQHYYDVYKGNLIWICNRYGWSYGNGANELQTYANRSKMALPDGSELAHKDRITDLEHEKEKVATELQMFKDKFDDLEAKYGNMEKALSMLNLLDEQQMESKTLLRGLMRGKKHDI